MLNICSCHGGAIFPGIIDPETKKSIIYGKNVTASPQKVKKNWV
jgi:hypothetical protein